MSRGPQWHPTGNVHIDAATYPVSRAMKHAKVVKVRRGKDFVADPWRALQLCIKDWEKNRITVWHRPYGSTTIDQEVSGLQEEVRLLKQALDKKEE